MTVDQLKALVCSLLASGRQPRAGPPPAAASSASASASASAPGDLARRNTAVLRQRLGQYIEMDMDAMDEQELSDSEWNTTFQS